MTNALILAALLQTAEPSAEPALPLVEAEPAAVEKVAGRQLLPPPRDLWGLESSAPPDDVDLLTALRLQNERRTALRGLLGENRWRRLDRARFEMDRAALDPWRDLREDSWRYELVSDAMRSSLWKLTRESLEHSLGLDRWIERHAGPRRSSAEADTGESGRSMHLRVSPRVGLSDRSYLGVKLGMRDHASPLLSGLRLRCDRRLEGSETSLRLTWERGNRFVSLQQVFDHPTQGDTLQLAVRFSM